VNRENVELEMWLINRRAQAGALVFLLHDLGQVCEGVFYKELSLLLRISNLSHLTTAHILK